MNQRELGEIRRRLRPDKNNIGHIYGCYVNSNKEIISYTDLSMNLASKDETEMFLNLLKKGISGSLGRNLINIDFSARQVMESEAPYKLLTDLRKSRLEDEELRKTFFAQVISCVDIPDTNYLILLGCDVYDVPFRGKDREVQDESRDVFPYIVCSVCPVKDAALELRYSNEEQTFHSMSTGHTVGSPALGFMFPAFDDRAANIYRALFYTRDKADIHASFVDTIFHIDPPMTSVEQNETFRDVLGTALEEDCRLEVVQAVHEQISSRIAEHKESHDPEPLELTPHDVGTILLDSGVSEERVESFRTRCEEEFGKNPVLDPKNIIDSKKFEVSTEAVNISVDPAFSWQVRTRVIDGARYILIPVEGAVEVNGVEITVEEPDAAPESEKEEN